MRLSETRVVIKAAQGTTGWSLAKLSLVLVLYGLRSRVVFGRSWKWLEISVDWLLDLVDRRFGADP